MTTQTAEQTEAQKKMAKVRAARKPKASPVTDVRLDKILGLLTPLSEQVQTLAERVTQLEGTKPQFVPMRRLERTPHRQTYVPPQELIARARAKLKKAGDTASGRMNYLQDPEQARKLPPEYRPVFESGDIVRLNPDAFIFGRTTKWGDVLAKQNCEGIGEVLTIQYITKTFEPKYTVVVPGLTRSNGDGFRESELLPVDA